jgi:hypothetical protein
MPIGRVSSISSRTGSITPPPPPNHTSNGKTRTLRNNYRFQETIDIAKETPRRRITLTIYAPVIYTAPCIMFWMRVCTLRGEVGGGWALEFPSFLSPVKWERAGRRVPFGAQKIPGPNPLPLPK